MREVDELDDAVHHRVAQRDNRINAAQGKSVNELLEKGIHLSAMLTHEAASQ
jgi:hypothetical protein